MSILRTNHDYRFCARVHENSIRINHESFPACFYDNGGKKASEHKDFVCEHLLLSEILAKVSDCFVSSWYYFSTSPRSGLISSLDMLTLQHLAKHPTKDLLF
ncbi:hypothetical protein K435DRAFT_248400 [Dendrothele bispora CBS 962.96]|uniref:Uncharacterized protein n=1 Tax=Dendrothele bispora (strain CBS 962.96) TaxID=1314807 RepID=A0A4S8MLQ7_DENBC|nr:hypothetical protein K435DRAFT_248400 [Dendrothele bispora CBS 962.96]